MLCATSTGSWHVHVNNACPGLFNEEHVVGVRREELVLEEQLPAGGHRHGAVAGDPHTIGPDAFRLVTLGHGESCSVIFGTFAAPDWMGTPEWSIPFH